YRARQPPPFHPPPLTPHCSPTILTSISFACATESPSIDSIHPRRRDRHAHVSRCNVQLFHRATSLRMRCPRSLRIPRVPLGSRLAQPRVQRIVDHESMFELLVIVLVQAR